MEKRVAFAVRCKAALIDVVVIVVIAGVLGPTLCRVLQIRTMVDTGPAIFSGVGGTFQRDLGAEAALRQNAADNRARGFGLTIVGFLYGLLEVFLETSLGKMVLGLKIGTADGREVTGTRLITRWVLKFSGLSIGFVGILTRVEFVWLFQIPFGIAAFAGYFMALCPNRQALYDRVAKTAVFRRTDLLA